MIRKKLLDKLVKMFCVFGILISQFVLSVKIYVNNLYGAEQNSQVVSLDQCINKAEENNLSLQGSDHKLRRDAFGVKEAYFKLLPDFDLDASYEKSNLLHDYSIGYKGQIRLPNLSNYFKIKSSKSQLETSKLDQILTHVNVIHDVKIAFINLAFAHKEVELYEKIIKRSLSNKKLSENRYKSGRDPKWTWLQSSLVYEQHLNSYEKIKKDIVIQNEKLINLIYSQDSKPSLILYPDISTIEEKIPDESQVLEKIHKHPKYLYSQSNLKQKEISYHEAICGYLPDMSVFATYDRHKIYDLNNDDSDNSSWKKSWSVGATLSLKLGSSFETYAHSQSFGEDLEAVKFSHQTTISDLKMSIKEAYRNYEDSLSSLKLAQLSLESSRSRASSQQKEYEVGLTDYTDWSNSQDQLANSERSLLNAQKNKLQAIIDLQQIIGE